MLPEAPKILLLRAMQGNPGPVSRIRRERASHSTMQLLFAKQGPHTLGRARSPAAQAGGGVCRVGAPGRNPAASPPSRCCATRRAGGTREDRRPATGAWPQSPFSGRLPAGARAGLGSEAPHRSTGRAREREGGQREQQTCRLHLAPPCFPVLLLECARPAGRRLCSDVHAFRCAVQAGASAQWTPAASARSS